MSSQGFYSIARLTLLACIYSACGDDDVATQQDTAGKSGMATAGVGGPAADSGSGGNALAGAGGSHARAGASGSNGNVSGTGAGNTGTAGTGSIVSAGTGGGTNGTPTHGWNELQGATIGTAKSAISDLRKSVRVNVMGDAEYMVARGFALRSSTTSISTKLTIEVTNHGSALRCFVQAKPLQRKAANGDVLPGTLDFSFVTGSIAMKDDIITASCLAPNESGYVITNDLTSSGKPSLYDQIDQVDITLSSSASDFQRPKFLLVPRSYTSNAQELSVTLFNEGSIDAPFDADSALEYLLVDDDGLPLDTGYLDVANPVTVAPGKSLMATGTLYFAGSTNRIRLVTSY